MYEFDASGLGFTNWRTSPGDPCSEVSGGQQRCFRTTTVAGDCPQHGGQCPPEQEFAAAQGCISRREPCSTSAGNPGIVWCCPPGWPLQPGSPPLGPGERPPQAPVVPASVARYAPWVVAVAAAGGALWYYMRQKGRV